MFITYYMLIVSITKNNIKISNFNKNLNIKEINFLFSIVYF